MDRLNPGWRNKKRMPFPDRIGHPHRCKAEQKLQLKEQFTTEDDVAYLKGFSIEQGQICAFANSDGTDLILQTQHAGWVVRGGAQRRLDRYAKLDNRTAERFCQGGGAAGVIGFNAATK